MQVRKNTIAGIEYEIRNSPTTIAEAVEICGGDENLLLEHFVQKLVYNHHNADVRSAFAEKLEELTGVKRKVETKDTGKKNEDGTPRLIEVFAETEGDYIARAVSEVGSEPSDFADAMQEIADANPLDGKKKIRASGGGSSRIAKMYVTAAEQIVSANAGEKAAKVLSQELGIEVKPEIESIARALKEREDRRRAAFAAEVKGLLG